MLNFSINRQNHRGIYAFIYLGTEEYNNIFISVTSPMNILGV
jgi:hypothetical protein